MTPVRTSRARPVFLAILAAFCLLTFGGSAHSSPSLFMSGGSVASHAGNAGAGPSAKAVPHADADLVTRSASSGMAFHVSPSAMELGASFALAGFGTWLLLRRRRPRRAASTHPYRPGPARAPPLAA